MPIQPVRLRTLDLDPADHPRGQPHLSSASGLVRAGERLYLAADDEHHLGELRADGQGPVRLHRFRAGDLPLEPAQRKRRKPDLESLAWLPPGAASPHGALLGLGSGSTPARLRGWHWALAGDGSLQGAPREIDLAAWWAPLRADGADLNIEGAFAEGGLLRLLQRANLGQPRNACIAFDLARVTAWCLGAAGVPPAPLHTGEIVLGDAGGVPLGWTDAVAWPGGGWLFSAVAEATADSYADGACAASALGRVSPAGELLWLRRIDGGPKVEGIAWDAAGALLMVTDADDPARPSELLAVDAAQLAD